MPGFGPVGSLPVGAVPIAATNTLTASTGSYVVTGQTTTFRKTLHTSLAAGSYTISGQSAHLFLPLHYTFQPSVGSYILTGQSATSHRAKVFYPASRTYVITGNPAHFSKAVYRATFSDFHDNLFKDFGDHDYTSYFETSQSLSDAQLKTQVPYIYTFLKEDLLSNTTTDGAKLQVRWDYLETDDSPRSTRYEDVYRYRNGFLTSVKKTKIRGKGRGVQMRYVSEPGKDFNILGWVIFYDTQTGQ